MASDRPACGSPSRSHPEAISASFRRGCRRPESNPSGAAASRPVSRRRSCSPTPKGTSVEIFSDYTFAKDDDSYTGVMPRKLGHVAFHTPDVAATVKFYCDVLGFKVSDWRSDFFAFLRCSRDHHTINLLQADNANIHHLAFELRDEAEINRACDFLARNNIKLFWGPIRHLIGHNIAIYHKNPDAITVEFFTDLDLMYDEELGYFEPRPWHQDRPQRPKVWGDDTPTNYWGPGHPHDMPGPKK